MADLKIRVVETPYDQGRVKISEHGKIFCLKVERNTPVDSRFLEIFLNFDEMSLLVSNMAKTMAECSSKEEYDRGYSKICKNISRLSESMNTWEKDQIVSMEREIMTNTDLNKYIREDSE